MQRIFFCRILAPIFLLLATLSLRGQGTAIFYQGRLSDSGALANTNYDFRFAVFTAPTNGTQVSVWVTNSAVPVANGLFAVTLNFGPGVFNGTANGSNDWMDVAVRATTATSVPPFTSLTPRQPILPVPYALFATSASNLLGSLQATQLVGTISSSVFSGAYSNGVNFVNSTNNFAGTFVGNGVNVSNLDASKITGGTLADARLTANVALLNGNQTYTGADTHNGSVTFNAVNIFTASNSFTGPNNFSGVNTFNNNGNYFQGNFFGNGLVGWTAVSGTAVTAVRDNGYMLTSSSMTTLTLPSSGLTPVDIVRVSGAGGGGWLVKENTGQSIIGNFARYTNSTLAPLSGPTKNGYSIAASADGVRMYAVGAEDAGVYASSDSGRTWASMGLNGAWTSIACSADGKTVYVQPSSGAIRKSTDSGVTWSSSGMPTGNGTTISCPADGSTVYQGNIACSGNGAYRGEISGGSILLSINSGSFNAITGPVGTVTCLAVSSDCTKILAGVNNGSLYASSNQGATWSVLVATNRLWKGGWMSPDGSKFAAAVAATTLTTYDGGVYRGDVFPVPNIVSTNSTIGGSQGSAVELQFVGGGVFMPVSSSGWLWAN